MITIILHIIKTEFSVLFKNINTSYRKKDFYLKSNSDDEIRSKGQL